MTIPKMIEFFSFILQCTMDVILGATSYYPYSLIRMVEASINELFPEISHDPTKT